MDPEAHAIMAGLIEGVAWLIPYRENLFAFLSHYQVEGCPCWSNCGRPTRLYRCSLFS